MKWRRESQDRLLRRQRKTDAAAAAAQRIVTNKNLRCLPKRPTAHERVTKNAMRPYMKGSTKMKPNRRIFNHIQNADKQVENLVLVDNGLAFQPELRGVATTLAYRICEG